jgi:probable phosphoglycerate mutase
MARIILARHGETDWNKAMRVQGGKSDTPLNEFGISQARQAALYLQKEEIAAVYASHLLRAQETARIIIDQRGLDIVVCPDLAEIDAGQYEGILTSELDRRFSQILSSLDKDGQLPPAPGGESIKDVQERSWKAVQAIAAQHNGRTVLVVTHYFVILAIVCKVLDLPLVNVGRFYMATGSISIVNLNRSLPRLEAFNIYLEKPQTPVILEFSFRNSETSKEYSKIGAIFKKKKYLSLLGTLSVIFIPLCVIPGIYAHSEGPCCSAERSYCHSERPPLSF